MDTLGVIKEIQAKLHENDFAQECYSWKENGKSSGKATQDCDIAIDFTSAKPVAKESFGFLDDILSKNHLSIISIEKDPYDEDDSELFRMKLIW